MLQWDFVWTGLYPGGTGIDVILFLVGSGLLLRTLAWTLERKASKGFRLPQAASSRFIQSYVRKPLRWDVLYIVSNSSASFLMSLWFLLEFGMIAALVAFLTMAQISGVHSRSLKDIGSQLNTNRLNSVRGDLIMKVSGVPEDEMETLLVRLLSHYGSEVARERRLEQDELTTLLRQLTTIPGAMGKAAESILSRKDRT